MSDEPSPRPWHFNGMRSTIYSDEKLPDGSARVVLDIETDHLPLLPCDENDRRLIADLALIVDSVNERDRLRDIVRRLVGYCEAVTVYRPPVVEVRGSDGTHDDYNGAELLREARAAIGEGAK